MVAPADADCGDPGIVCHLHIECCVAYYVRIRRLDPGVRQRALDHFGMRLPEARVGCLQGDEAMIEIMALPHRPQIGKASCRDRVCQYVTLSVVAGSIKK